MDTEVNNWAYVIKDRCTIAGVVNDNCNANAATWPLEKSDLLDITDLCVLGTEAGCLASRDPTNADGGYNQNWVNGWKLNLEAGGEKGLSKPLLANGLVIFTTYSPVGGAQNACGPSEGTSYVYVVNLKDGSVKFNLDTDPDQATAKSDRFADIGPGIAGDVIVVDGDTILVPGKGIPNSGDDDCVGDDCGPPPPPCHGQFCKPGGASLWRIYWREEGVDRL